MLESVPPSTTVLEPGTILDRYELLCTIARGGMAHVWLGRFKGKHGFEKLVAVKTILPEHALDPRFRNMFLDEARIASGVEHPNVAKILDLGEWHDCLYLVMEYVDGDSLSRLRRSLEKQGQMLPLPIVLRVLADICGGLHSAHELRGDDSALLGVVHRDVSPQNVLIPTNGVSKLIDFGVAKARHRLGEETSAGFAKGKSRYMSPEQALAKPVDRRADLFAVGAMAYEMFEGSAPYDGPNDMARLHALITGHEIASVPHAPHPTIEKLILKALAREPEARYSTAHEMRAELEDAMVSLKVRASVDDVAAFVVAHTKERMSERKGVVKVALDAAAERQRIKDVLAQGTVSGGTAEVSSSSSSASRPKTDGPAPDSVSPPAFAASVHEDGPHPLAAKPRLWPIVAGGVFLAGSLLLAAVLLHARHPETATKTAAVAESASVVAAAPTHSASTAVNVPPPPADSANMAADPAPSANAVVDASAAQARSPHPHSAPKAPTTTTTRHGTKAHEVVIQ